MQIAATVSKIKIQFKTVNSEAVQRTKTSEIKENKNMAG